MYFMELQQIHRRAEEAPPAPVVEIVKQEGKQPYFFFLFAVISLDADGNHFFQIRFLAPVVIKESYSSMRSYFSHG